MSGVAEFILARVAEDEATARLARDNLYVCEPDGCIESEPPLGDNLPNHHGVWHELYKPDRVLAECAAKRALCDYIQAMEMQIDGEWGVHGDYRDAAGKAIRFGPDLMEGLHIMAAPYSDHPDFDPAWAVEASV